MIKHKIRIISDLEVFFIVNLIKPTVLEIIFFYTIFQ